MKNKNEKSASSLKMKLENEKSVSTRSYEWSTLGFSYSLTSKLIWYFIQSLLSSFLKTIGRHGGIIYVLQ